MDKEANHFIGKDLVVRKIYKQLVDELIRLGFLRIEPKKSQITFVHHRPFANIVVRPSYINIAFELNYMLPDFDRFTRIERVSDSRFRHTLHLQQEEDLTEEAFGWLREAYFLNG